ncbi:hypothetical protein QQF64_033807 [Cirrhinus molitorella]|uniref:Uncharacterized protein n=1 Tax=Cirrhinus molitorella TaxID=172907 RepID=A0ABR3MUX5_9TELE
MTHEDCMSFSIACTPDASSLASCAASTSVKATSSSSPEQPSSPATSSSSPEQPSSPDPKKATSSSSPEQPSSPDPKKATSSSSPVQPSSPDPKKATSSSSPEQPSSPDPKKATSSSSPEQPSSPATSSFSPEQPSSPDPKKATSSSSPVQPSSPDPKKATSSSSPEQPSSPDPKKATSSSSPQQPSSPVSLSCHASSSAMSSSQLSETLLLKEMHLRPSRKRQYSGSAFNDSDISDYSDVDYVPQISSNESDGSTSEHDVPESCSEAGGSSERFGLEVSKDFKKILSFMNYDDVSCTIHSDTCIMQLGEHMFNRMGTDVTKHDYIRQKMREVGRLLLEARKITPLRTMADFIIPANFKHVISAVKVVSGFDEETNSYRIPSLALKLGHSLNKICSIVERNAMMYGDHERAECARDFRKVHQARWNEYISAGALTTLKEAKWNAPQIIPFTQDVKVLHAHLEKKHDEFLNKLRNSPSAENYAALAKVTLSQVILFNRQREGEVSRMLLSSFQSRDSSELHEDIAICLSEFERKLCNHFTRVEIRGKRGRKVPVLLKPSLVSAMELLVKTHEVCGVPAQNPFIFARSGAMSAYRGGECVRRALLNLDENEADQLAHFLCHDIRIHRQYYRLPEGMLQLAKMSKVLMAMEKGTLSNFKGKRLDDTEIDPNEQLEEPDDSISSDEEEADAARCSDIAETTAPADTDQVCASQKDEERSDQYMDPVSASELRDILSSSNARMDWQEEQITATGHAVQALLTQVSELTTQVQQLKNESAQQPTALNLPVSPPVDYSARLVLMQPEMTVPLVRFVNDDHINPNSRMKTICVDGKPQSMLICYEEHQS